MFEVSDTWKTSYPGASVGVLAMRGVSNPDHDPALEQRKADLETELRSRYAGWDRAQFKAIPTIQAYNAYYKRFKKSYHVQLQLESIVLKGKSIPRVAALVEAMFMAELKNLLLTAGHDLNRVDLPLRLDVSDGSQQYLRINGQEQTLKQGDMMISDSVAVISSILYGPDQRTQIGPDTKDVVFTVYAPPGIEADLVDQHLRDLQANVLLVQPQAELELMDVIGSR